MFKFNMNLNSNAMNNNLNYNVNYNSYSSYLKPKTVMYNPGINSSNNNSYNMNDMLKKQRYIHKGNMFDTLKRTTGCGCAS